MGPSVISVSEVTMVVMNVAAGILMGKVGYFVSMNRVVVVVWLPLLFNSRQQAFIEMKTL